MATKTKVIPRGETVPSGDANLIEYRKPEWDHYKKRYVCKIWEAVMLSLDIQPSPKGRRWLCESELSEEFYRRLDHINSRYGRDESLPESDANFGKPRDKSDRYLDLNDLLRFAQVTQWAGFANLERGLANVESVSKSDTGGTSHAGGRTVLAERRKGERYSLLRLGAVLEVFDNFVVTGRHRKIDDLIVGGTLNMAALSREVDAMVADASGRPQGGAKVVGTNVGTLQKEFNEARRVFAMLTSDASASSTKGNSKDS